MRDQTLMEENSKIRFLAYLSRILDAVRCEPEEMVCLALHRTQTAMLPSDPLLLIREHGVFLERELALWIYMMQVNTPSNLTSHRSGRKTLTVMSSKIRKDGWKIMNRVSSALPHHDHHNQ
jgi:hypothetical protein